MIAFRPLDLLVLIGVMLIWGSNFAVVKIGLEELSPLFFMTLRFAVVALILVPFVKRPRGHFAAIFAISVVLGFIHFTLMFIALGTIDVATAAIAIQLQVPLTALLAWAFLADKLGWRRALGMAVAFGGVIAIAGEPRLEGQYLALAMVIGAAACWAVAAVIMKRLGALDGTVVNAWMALFATPQLLIASLIFEQGQWQALSDATLISVFCVLYQSLAVVVVGYGIWFRMLKRYDLNQVMPIMLTIPFIGVLSGVLFLGETLTATLIGGGLATVLGVGIIILRRPALAAPEADGL